MRRYEFEPPTDHYDQRIKDLDQQICELIKKRKDLSDNNPGFPTKQLISAWSKQFNFYEGFLNSVFMDFLNEDIYKPVVDPKGFLKNIPILKSFEKDKVFYSVTFMRQYKNASVIQFTIDRENSEEEIHTGFEDHTYFKLSIEGEEVEYDCRNDFGSGSGGHMSYSFIVSPTLPEDISQTKLIFTEYKVPFDKPTGFEFVI
ncbi:hypothetical protein [Bacillus niameyensis]|uniref:hypothetical protein n=1 Tax=Bacillus niameyensis TaxID=1522308 RepID=UPI0007842EA7|nr:hypothetical protein [Bacillus niameyensis]